MKTTEYHWYLPAFPEYNVAQSAAVPFLDQDMNLVISFPTASGKTALAEAAMAYHLATNSQCRVAYVCPFKSLASEKFQAWSSEWQLNRYGIVLWSSDNDGHDVVDARIVIATMESFDFKTRSKMWEPWIKSLGIAVFDESHLIADKNRGGALEASIMRMTTINPDARIVLMSATMSNGMDLAKWVKSLNGKPTKCISSSWIPSEVHLRYHVIGDYSEKVEKAVELAKQSGSKKTLVFVHSKVTGAEIVKRLRKMRVRAVFHNASLSASKRRKIEDVFNDPTSGLNICVSTSTLGSGVNAG